MTNDSAVRTAVALTYPVVDREDTVEVLHGVTVADPYRYLEDPDADRTKAFVEAQNAVSAPYLAGLPSQAPMHALTTSLLTGARAGVPWERGGRYFRLANPGELNQDRLHWAESLDELADGGQVVLDPNELADDGTVALTAASVSPDGTLIAYALSEAGSDWRTIRVREVATGADLPDVLTWTKWVDPTWMPDGSGFLYWRYPAPDGGEYTDVMDAGELVLHRLGTEQGTDLPIWARPQDDLWRAYPSVSADGAWLMLTAAPGTDSRTVIEVRRIIDGPAGATPEADGQLVVAELGDAHDPIDVVDNQLFLRTERDAERGRLVSVDLNRPADEWTTIVPERAEEVLAQAKSCDGGFVLVWAHDAAHGVEVVDRTGEQRTVLALPFPSSVAGIGARAASSEVFVGSTSFTRRMSITRLDLTTEIATDVPAGDPVPMPPTVAERRHGISADGTRVPMTVVRRADLPDGPAPTLLYGYGGFDIPVLPVFSALFSGWVAAGGVLAVANLRGGGEFGQAWHQAGMLHRKQNVFDDLYGCAEALIADGTTTSSQLAVHGRSNGGLLTGAALTQRPTLWAATLPTVGVMDMLRYHLFTCGAGWSPEYGSPDDAADFAVLHAYSPLHQLVEGTEYPPTLICTGDHDDRVVPAHSHKFGAEMQRCQSGPAPVLLRIDTRAGHGIGKPVSALAAEYADQLAFAAEHTGLVPQV